MYFTQKVIDLFIKPENAGELADADGIGEAGDPHCGDFLRIYIQVREGVIKDCTFQVFGCCAAIASSSMTTILAKGQALDDAEKITAQDIVHALGGLPEEKVHCSVLGESALKAAIENYRKNDQ
ncbi:iron-sulfur cluster assembly scaffold protein [Candidatus Formimonas warabiya]|uniref:Iron-sulfur cluster assembly scaffold protein n=1 Tax=Formimonas warabiya TaxID=1761012 RepID=A0A3G1KYP8_FORW1|nr:iron-sulfur cluster assembly scaffold protein [Candidatus Formimonas warabiya]ATW27530.1 iron-sulfur cluster assembly scaffold protein [Candidatus Formimonas warabiya]